MRTLIPAPCWWPSCLGGGCRVLILGERNDPLCHMVENTTYIDHFEYFGWVGQKSAFGGIQTALHN